MWNPPHRRPGYYCHHPRTNTLTYTILDHCRPAYLIQYSSSLEIRELSYTFIHCLLSLYLFISFISFFTYSPLSHLPSSCSSCYSHSFLSLMHDPSFSPFSYFSPCCHICYNKVNILQAGSTPVLSAAKSSSPAFPLLLPKFFSNRSTSSCPSAVQVPQKALVLKRGGRFFPRLGSK